MSKNVELLITLVQNHRILWDPADELYRKYKIVRETWNKIAKQCGLPGHHRGEAVKLQWRKLRLKFRQELKKAKIENNEDDVTPLESDWPYFKQMQFLMEVLNSSTVKSICVQNSDTSTETVAAAQGTSVQQNENFIPENNIPELQNESPVLCSTFRTIQIRPASADLLINSVQSHNTVEQNFSNVHSMKAEENDDENVRFALSLVPILQELPLVAQLNSKIKIQELLMTELLKIKKNQ